MHRPRRLLALLACGLALVSAPRADEGAASGRAPPPPPPATGEGVPREEPPSPEDGWIDVGHAFVEQRIFAPVLRFDRFFSDERDIDAERSRSFLRWRSEVRLDEPHGTRPMFRTSVSANIRLPGLNRRVSRLRLVIAGETRDAVNALFPRTPAPTEPVDAQTENIGGGDAGLRLQLLDTLVTHADLGGGVLLRLPPGVFGRLRLRWAFPITRTLLGRTALIGFWRTDTEFGSTATADLERPLTPLLVTRLAGTATISEVSRGVEWGSELTLLASLGPRSGAQLGLAMSGATRNSLVTVSQGPTAVPATRRSPGVDVYRVYTRLRRDVYRRWFFIELEPGLSWPWDPVLGRHGEWAVAFRVEVQFQGKEAPVRPPPPPPPEPQDPPDVDAPAAKGSQEPSQPAAPEPPEATPARER